eukprot:671152-Rhodomonas_salina.5
MMVCSESSAFARRGSREAHRHGALSCLNGGKLSSQSLLKIFLLDVIIKLESTERAAVSGELKDSTPVKFLWRGLRFKEPRRADGLFAGQFPAVGATGSATPDFLH